MLTENDASSRRRRDPWNKGRLIGQKRPLKPKDVWTIRVRLQLEDRKRDLAMFDLAIDSKLRSCDLVRLQINDVFEQGCGPGVPPRPQPHGSRSQYPGAAIDPSWPLSRPNVGPESGHSLCDRARPLA